MINEYQLEKLYDVLKKREIRPSWVKIMLNVKQLSDISVKQYNFLIFILEGGRNNV